MIKEVIFVFGIIDVYIVCRTGTHTGTAVVMIVAHMLLRYKKKKKLPTVKRQVRTLSNLSIDNFPFHNWTKIS